MIKCPDCKQYVCECEPSTAIMPWKVSKNSEESPDQFKMLKQRTPLPALPKKENLPMCVRLGGYPDHGWHGDWACYPCNKISRMLVCERYTNKEAF